MMRRIPTKLKQMAEQRARIAGDFAHCKESNDTLLEEVSQLSQRLSLAKSFLDPSTVKLARLTKELAAIDEAIIALHPNVNPQSIQSIKAWKGKYGKRGGLREFLVRELKQRHPEYLSLAELMPLAIQEFSLVFCDFKEQERFQNKSIRGAVQLLTTQGILERGGTRIYITQACGTWRWKQESQPTLADLVNSKPHLS